jgi:hypothetical protein
MTMNLSQTRDPRFWKRWQAAGAVESIVEAEDREIAAMRKVHGDIAVVRKIGGKIVLDDPQAVAVFQAVAKHNCAGTFEMNADRVIHFKNRMTERGLGAQDVVIVLVNVDDVHGGPLADALMPGANWQQYRDMGQVPFARGLAGRAGMQDILSNFDKAAAEKLQKSEVPSVVVVDHGVAEVFPA